MGAAPDPEDTLGRQAVSGAPQVMVHPPPLTAQGSEGHLPP